MSSHARNFPSAEDVIMPWNRRYPFPTIANKAEMVTSRVPSKVAGPFNPGNTISIDFPAQGYINPADTFIEFDVKLTSSGGSATGARFQNNIQSIFDRVEIKYGSNPLEDITGYNCIIRPLTEWVTTSGQCFDQSSIMEGIGGVVFDGFLNTSTGAAIGTGYRNVRQYYIQGVDGQPATAGGAGTINATRRYCVQIMAGLMQQRKLIPTQWMANQFTVNITLAPVDKCLYKTGTQGTLTYEVSNVNLIPSVLFFDQTFDAMFAEGLAKGGIPIKFSTWRQYIAEAKQTNNIIISDRAKSLKSIFTFLKRTNPTVGFDYGASPFFPGYNGTLRDYQYQVGTRMFPASPVVCGSGSTTNGGAEAYAELAKALHTVGNYQLSAPVNALKWGHPMCNATTYAGEAETDYERFTYAMTPNGTFLTSPSIGTWHTSGLGGAQCFCMAISFETAASADYSGLNAEQASSIILRANYSGVPGSVAAGGAADVSYQLMSFCYVDKMLVLHSNNNVRIIE